MDGIKISGIRLTVCGIVAHYLMSFIGGFVGIFSVTLLLGSFGAAQTGNMISIIATVLGGDMQEFLLRLICLLIFFVAIVFSTLLGERCARMKLVCVVMDIAMVIVLELLPHQLNRIIYLYPISFAMTMQWQSFRGIEGCYSATPFTTNNLRQFMTAVVYWVEKGKAQRKNYALKAAFYLFTILSFASGIVAGYFACLAFDLLSLWFCLIPLAIVLPLTIILKEQKKAN